MTKSDASALQELSKFLWNSEIWRVAMKIQHRFEEGYSPSDVDSLRLDFRRLLPEPEGKIKHRHLGSLSFDTNSCGLRLERAGEIVVACGDSSEKVLGQFRQLVGRTLIRVEVAPPGGDSNFVLAGELFLRCFPAVGREGEIWRVSSADGDELVLGPGAQWSYRSGLR